MNWTKKHDGAFKHLNQVQVSAPHEWCLFFGLRPSAQYLYRWIHRRTKGHTVEEIEIDLRDFNQWIAKKRSRPYDRKTLKTAIAQLIEDTEGLIVQQKEITWFYRKLIVKPIAFLDSDRKPKSGKSPNPQSSKPSWHRSSKDEEWLQQRCIKLCDVNDPAPPSGASVRFKLRGKPTQQRTWERAPRQQHNIDCIDKLLRKIGLRFDRDGLNRIWQLSGRCIDKVVQSVELLLHRNSTKTIVNPHGFIIDCLKFNWQEGFDLYYAQELPKFSCLGELRQFISEIRKPIRDEVELCH